MWIEGYCDAITDNWPDNTDTTQAFVTAAVGYRILHLLWLVGHPEISMLTRWRQNDAIQK